MGRECESESTYVKKKAWGLKVDDDVKVEVDEGNLQGTMTDFGVELFGTQLTEDWAAVVVEDRVGGGALVAFTKIGKD